jgi:hypothetical protein
VQGVGGEDGEGEEVLVFEVLVWRLLVPPV